MNVSLNLIHQLEKRINDLKEEKNTAVKNQNYEKAADLRDDQSKIERQLEYAKIQWEKYGVDVKRLEKMSIRINDGKLELIFQQDNGTVVYSDGTIEYTSSILVNSISSYSIRIKQLQDLINKPDLKEQELQDFFEENPEFVCEDKYETLIPQAIVQSPIDTSWKIDIALVPKDQIDFAKLIELKLPKERIFTKSNSNHLSFSSKLLKAINQLKDYAEAFENSNVREKFKNKYKTEIFRPNMQLIYGRRPSNAQINQFKILQKRENIEITDWDTLVERFKRKFK